MTTFAAGFDSYRRKLLDTHRELVLIETFLTPSRRPGALAFECLVHELNDAALRIEEPQVADAKLAWWFAEMESALAGVARHPITQTLFSRGSVPHLHFHFGALRDAVNAMRRDSAPIETASQVATMSDWFAGLLEFGRVAGALHHAEAKQGARARAVHQLVRELARLRPGATAHALALPLNLLARHQLNRAELCLPGAARDAALRDQVQQLQSLLSPGAAGADLVSRVRRRLDRIVLRRAVTAPEPGAFLARELTRLRPATVWHVWREARVEARIG